MGTGRVRRTLARLVGAVGAIVVAITLIAFGPRAADLPASFHDLPDWFTAAPEQGLVTIIAAVAWLCLLWLCLGVLLAAAAAIPGGLGRLSGALARLVLPRAMRRLVEVSLGVTLVAGIGPVMTALPAMANPVVPANPGAGVTAAAWPDLDRQAVSRTPLTADLSRPSMSTAPTLPPATPAHSGDAAVSPSPTLSVPGVDVPIPIIDLRETAPAPTPAASTPAGSAHTESPEAARGGVPVHTAPDPGVSVPLTPARVSADWPDLGRPSAAAPRAAAPSTTPPGPAPAGGTSSASAPAPAARTTQAPSPAPGAGSAPGAGTAAAPPSRAASAAPNDPLVPSAHRGTGVPAAGAAGSGQSGEEIVVRRGDTLWSIAARALGPDATTDQIAAEWPRWWAANLGVIGHDPNVILPGQRLTPPTGP
ncbi:LysM peptidoglycan-binding domain-containing protein [Candidatus Frankia nodulisporulans]|uniref:LysM peptidoglycan-binding domain-containing protein n=1 Tax=Candidatus Frankia nodulisporulans TaxID=2060052 RepID=UPI0013D38395|nr:LysM domain-containing protein [Candidatus Frankia nodulisporulans]